MDKTLLKIVLLGLIVINLGIWGYIEYAPRWDIQHICKAYTEFSQDKQLGVAGVAAVTKLSQNLDSMWTREGKNVASTLSQMDPVFRRKELERAGFEVGLRFWSCPGITLK